MKRTIFALLVLGAIYVGTVIYGSVPRRSACGSDEEFAVFLAKQERGTEGSYMVRRSFPQLDELIPFQSTFVVSRNGEDCARVTLRRPFWTQNGTYNFTPIPTSRSKIPNQTPEPTAPSGRGSP
jgi:hypothetical protein